MVELSTGINCQRPQSVDHHASRVMEGRESLRLAAASLNALKCLLLGRLWDPHCLLSETPSGSARVSTLLMSKVADLRHKILEVIPLEGWHRLLPFSGV